MVDVPVPPFGTSVTDEVLRNRMLESMKSDLDRSEGSLPYSLISPFAVELDRLYDQLDMVLDIGWAQTTYGGFLDARAEEHGVFRRGATFASGEVTFTGTNDVEIVEGTLVSTLGSAGQNPVTFRVTAPGTIAAGEVTLPVQAVIEGAEGNVPAGSVTQMVGFIPGVLTVTNAAAMAGGADEESDDLLRARLLQKVSAGMGAGSAGDYVVWAQEVAGVGPVSVVPVADGPGTVTVVVLGVDGLPVDGAILTAVEEHIATRAPIGADVTVVTPTTASIDVDATVTVEAGLSLEAITPGVEAAVAAYFATLAPGSDVIYTEVSAAIVTAPGVADVTALTIEYDDGPKTANIAIPDDEIAIVGTVTLGETA